MATLLDHGSLDLLNITSNGSTKAFVRGATEKRLTSLSLSLFDEIMNKRNFTSALLRHWDINIHQDFPQCYPETSGRNEVLGDIQSMLDSNPDFHMMFVNTCARVNERTGRATVWLVAIASGIETLVGWKEGVHELSWVRKEREWVCTRHRAMTGFSTGTIYDGMNAFAGF